MLTQDLSRLLGLEVRSVGQGLNSRLLMFMEQHPKSPEGLFAALRRHKPILLAGDSALVTRFADVQEVMTQPAFTVSLYPPRMVPLTGWTPLAMDNTPEYRHDSDALRLAMSGASISDEDATTLSRAMSAQDVQRISRFVTASAEALVSAAAPAGSIDLVQGLANLVPMRLCGDFFGTPGLDEVSQLYWARTLYLEMFMKVTDESTTPPEVLAVAAAWNAYVDSQMARRRAEMAAGVAVPDDILGRLLGRQPQTGLCDDKIRGNLIHMMIGFLPQMAKVTALAVQELLERPDALAGAQRAARDDNDDLLGAYVWEALRFNAHPAGLFRRCAFDADYVLARGMPHATRIPAGTIVFAALQSAMFDETVVEQPLLFRLDRPWEHYQFFGLGQHTCLGRYVSRLAVPLIAKPLLRQRNLRRAPGASGQLAWNGPFPQSMTVLFDGGASP